MDEITLLTLRVIALEEALKKIPEKIPDYKTDIGNIYFRLKALEDQKFAQELQIITAEIKELKKKTIEASQKKFNLRDLWR